MLELCPAERAGTPDEVGNVAALLMSAEGAFITGSDFLVDGGVTASYWFGELGKGGRGETTRQQLRGRQAGKGNFPRVPTKFVFAGFWSPADLPVARAGALTENG